MRKKQYTCKRHIATSQQTPFCESYRAIVDLEFLPDDWPLSDFPEDCCSSCVRIMRVVRRNVRSDWSRDRIRFLPEATRRLICQDKQTDL